MVESWSVGHGWQDNPPVYGDAPRGYSHASNNVAKSLIVFEKVISRDRLRPSFGKGKMSGGMAENINPKLGGDG